MLLESIAAQTDAPDQVIVVNSHSTDDTVKRAESFKNQLPLRIHNAKQKGVASARNEGAAITSADYLVFIDSDATLPRHFIEKLRQTITKRRIDLGAFKQVMDTNNTGIRIGGGMMNGYVRLMSVTPWPIFFSCFFIRRKLFEKIGGFDKEIFVMEDYDLALRGRRAGGKFGIVRGTFFYSSPRRYEAADGGQSIRNGIYAELYRYTHGMRITKPLFTYEMGGKDKSKQN